jgi:hypothetical protein
MLYRFWEIMEACHSIIKLKNMEDKDSKVNIYVKSGMDDPAVKSALKLFGNTNSTHNRHEGYWRAIQQLFEGGFTVTNPTGTKKITSKLLLQILWKVVNKMKVPDFKIHKAGPFAVKTKPDEIKKDSMTRDIIEQIVTAGVSTVMKEGRFLQCMRDKGGAFYKAALFGDCHVQVGYDLDNSDYPISFKVGSLSDFYMNASATDIRDPVGGLSADEVVMVYRYTLEQFNQLFPHMKNKVPHGDIPRAYRYRKQLEKTWLQTVFDADKEVEVAYRIGVDGTQVIFAGPACVVVEKLEGKEFPYKMDGKNYIPILHFKFFPSSEGYYNYGIGHMVYDLAVVTAQMDNMAYNHAGDNIWPISFVNTPNKNASKLFNEILKAHEMRAAGGKGYVVSENQLGQGSGVTIEPFQTQPITQEWERAFMRLEQQVERLGFHLDSPDLGANPNEMSIMADQEATDAPIKQIIEYNASSFEDAVNFTINAIREHIEDDDQTPINSTVDIEAGDAMLPMRGFPLGWIAQELRKNKYFVVVNSRDGTIPSNVMEQAQITKTMSTLVPGTPAWNKMSIKMAKLNGQNLQDADLAQPQMPQGGPQEVQNQPIPTETSATSAVSLKHPALAQ